MKYLCNQQEMLFHIKEQCIVDFFFIDCNYLYTVGSLETT